MNTYPINPKILSRIRSLDAEITSKQVAVRELMQCAASLALDGVTLPEGEQLNLNFETGMIEVPDAPSAPE